MAGDIETVKKTIAAALLSADFLTALAAVDAEKNDGTTTPGPAVGYDHERSVLEAFPAFELQGLTTAYDLQDDVKAGTHRIAIVWTYTSDDEGAVTRTIERLVRATVDLNWRSVLGGQIGLAPMLIESEDFSALMPAKDAPFLKGGRVIVAATTFRA